MTAEDSRHRFATLCRMEDIADGGAKGVEIGEKPKRLDIVLLRKGEKVWGFLNRCPHRGHPLETFPDAFLDETGEHLICTNHGARFRATDGYCVKGPCERLSLVKMPIVLVDGAVILDVPIDIALDLLT